MNKLISLLERTLNSRSKKLTKKDEYMFFSPFVSHYKPKLQINMESQKWHCWISNQGGHSLYSLFKKVNADSKYFSELKDIVFIPTKKDEVESKVIVSLPREYQSLSSVRKSLFYKHAIKFLKQRGIDKTDIKKHKIGFCDDGMYQNRIIIPSYDSDGKLNYFVGRDFYKGGMKYKNPPVAKDIIGFDLYIDWNQPIILCEGVFDAMAIKNNSIPLFGKTILPKLARKIVEKQVSHIIISLDDDAFASSVKMIDEFLKNGIRVSFVKLKGSDPSELGYHKMVSQLSSSVNVDFKELMRMKIYGNI